ncbi:hypothetical protein PG990_009875 [Apiospora arundinis]
MSGFAGWLLHGVATDTRAALPQVSYAGVGVVTAVVTVARVVSGTVGAVTATIVNPHSAVGRCRSRASSAEGYWGSLGAESLPNFLPLLCCGLLLLLSPPRRDPAE